MASGKNSKIARIKENKELVKDLKAQVAAAVKSREAKIEAVKLDFTVQAEAAAAKYRTVNGYMQARDTLVVASGNGEPASAWHNEALKLAGTMSATITGILQKFKKCKGTDEMQNIYDGLFDDEFIDNNPSVEFTAYQILIGQTLGYLSDITERLLEFDKATIQEIEKVEATLEEAQTKKS